MTYSFAEVSWAESALILAQREHVIGTAVRTGGAERGWREARSGGAMERDALDTGESQRFRIYREAV
jgi:hypothetical protein